MKVRGTAMFVLGFAATLWAGWSAFPRALYRSASQPLNFSHKVHSGDKVGMACDDCHAVGEDGRFAGIPKLEKCSGCHAEPVTADADEKILVERYVKPEREVPWLVYSRQPDNVAFSHAIHINRAKLKCEKCHAGHDKTDKLRPYEENRVSGYSRDIWGTSISRLVAKPGARPGMKMDDCAQCHAQNKVVTSCLDCHK